MKSACVSVVPPLFTRRKISATCSSSTSWPICTAKNGIVLQTAESSERLAKLRSPVRPRAPRVLPCAGDR